MIHLETRIHAWRFLTFSPAIKRLEKAEAEIAVGEC